MQRKSNSFTVKKILKYYGPLKEYLTCPPSDAPSRDIENRGKRCITESSHTEIALLVYCRTNEIRGVGLKRVSVSYSLNSLQPREKQAGGHKAKSAVDKFPKSTTSICHFLIKYN